MPRQRLWKIRASAVVLASGAHERGIAYANNDLPGTMLAGAARTYVERYAVRPGTRAIVFTNNDSAYATALALRTPASTIGGDRRRASGGALLATLPSTGRAPPDCRSSPASAIVGAHGRGTSRAVDIVPLAGGAARRLDCDLVCVSGGWNPAVHLFSQARGSLRYDEALATFVPDSSPLPILPAGAANGRFGLAAALADGHAAGVRRRGACRSAPHALARDAPQADAAADRRAAADVERRRAAQGCEALRRPAERRHGRGHRARRARGLSRRSST